MLADKTVEKIGAMMKVQPDRHSAVMGALWAVQQDGKGYLTRDDLEEISKILKIAPVEVQAAATFYTMYNVVDPVGKYHIQVCRNISCWLLGAEKIIAHIEKILDIKTGGTTADKRFSLKTVECLGSCGTAPMMQINDDYYENLTFESVDQILKNLL